MKKSINILAISTLLFSVQTVQAHITEDATHTHEGSQMRSTIQAMSPADRMNFRDTMRTNIESMPEENRQAFRDRMRAEHGMSQGSGQRNQYMYGEQQGAGSGERRGYGRGYGR